jgi:Fur family zinc uptake transcriptional regulator
MMKKESANTATALFPGRDHDHAFCVAAIVAAAERVCAQRRTRLTDQRRKVLEVVAASHTAIGAYEIMARLGTEGRPPAPVSVYRALDFLIAAGLIHRLASLNAYVVCAHPCERHGAQFLICQRCGVIAEMTSAAVTDAITAGAEAAGFAITSPLVELAGVCGSCRTEGDAPVAH